MGGSRKVPNQTGQPLSTPIRVLIADTRPLVRIGMRLNLERARNAEVVGETAELPMSLDVVRTCAPDVIIIGNSFAVDAANTFAESILQQFPNTRFIILTDEIPAAAKPRQMTYLPHTCTGNELVTAVLRQ